MKKEIKTILELFGRLYLFLTLNYLFSNNEQVMGLDIWIILGIWVLLPLIYYFLEKKND